MDDDTLFAAVRDAFLAAGGVCPLTRFDRHFRYHASLFTHRGMGWDATKRAFRRWAEANAPDFPYMDQLPALDGEEALRDGPQGSTGDLLRANGGKADGGESALRDGPSDLLRANGEREQEPFRANGEGEREPFVRGDEDTQKPFVLTSAAERRVSKDEGPTPAPASAASPAGRPVRAPRPRALGDAIAFRAMQHAPVNEHGVILLFGMVAADLGFMVETVAAGFPDCEAKRRVAPGRWVRARIEFEYLSRNFVAHAHDPRGCDLIVCWRHNWPDCPLDVLELESAIAALAAPQP